MVSSYIWVDFRLKGPSIESMSTQKGLRTKTLRSSEVEGHNQKIRCTEPVGAYSFLSFYDIIGVQVALSYKWVYARLKGLSIEPKNSHNEILTKGLRKLQAIKKISNLQHLQQQHQQPLFLVIFGCSINTIWYQDIYGWIRDLKGLP